MVSVVQRHEEVLIKDVYSGHWTTKYSTIISRDHTKDQHKESIQESIQRLGKQAHTVAYTHTVEESHKYLPHSG